MDSAKFDERCREIKKRKMTMVRQRYQLISSIDIDDQRIMKYDWTYKRHTWPHPPTKSGSYKC